MTLTRSQCKLLAERGLKPPENAFGCLFTVEHFPDKPAICVRDKDGVLSLGAETWSGGYQKKDCTYHPTVETLLRFVPTLGGAQIGVSLNVDKGLWWAEFLGRTDTEEPAYVDGEADTPLLALYRLIMQITKEEG